MRHFIVILDGPIGAGKSTIGALLHKQLKRTALINTDRIKWFISDFRRSKRDNAIARKVLLSIVDAFLAQKISLIVAEPFNKSTRPIDPFLDLVRMHRAKLFVYHLDAPKEVLLKRIAARPRTEKSRPPMPKSRILRNIRIWKKEHIIVGKLIETHKTSKEKMVKDILKDLRVR